MLQEASKHQTTFQIQMSQLDKVRTYKHVARREFNKIA